MNMTLTRYTIFSIDDSRRHYKESITKYIDNYMGWEYRPTESVNGADRAALESNIERYGYRINWKDSQSLRVGHLGIWFTVLNSFDLAPHVTFEDDAMLGPGFSQNWKTRMLQLPKDADFFSLFLPRDSDHLYNDSLSASKLITKTYQKYGGVSMYYTKQGVQKIKELLKRDGITDQYDNSLYEYSRNGELNGYCSKPSLPDLVYISGEERSIVQESAEYARVETV